MQHKLAAFFAKHLLSGNDTEENRILLTYGIEIFLNEFLKFLLVMALGVIFGYWKITLLSTVYILVIRQILGGRHFESNVLCTLYTILSAFLLPSVVSNINVSSKILLFLIAVEIVMVLLFCSYEENTECRSYKRSVTAVLTFLVFLFISYKVGGIRFVGSMTSAHLLVEIMCIKIFPHQTNDEGMV